MACADGSGVGKTGAGTVAACCSTGAGVISAGMGLAARAVFTTGAGLVASGWGGATGETAASLLLALLVVDGAVEALSIGAGGAAAGIGAFEAMTGLDAGVESDEEFRKL